LAPGVDFLQPKVIKNDLRQIIFSLNDPDSNPKKETPHLNFGEKYEIGHCRYSKRQAGFNLPKRLKNVEWTLGWRFNLAVGLSIINYVIM
jgi:hypothetical protein